MDKPFDFLSVMKQMAALKEFEALVRMVISNTKLLYTSGEAIIVLREKGNNNQLKAFTEKSGDNICIVKNELTLPSNPSYLEDGSMVVKDNSALLKQTGFRHEVALFYYFDYDKEITGGILMALPSQPLIDSLRLKDFIEYCGLCLCRLISINELNTTANFLYNYDHLVTQLPNRLFFKKYLTDIISRSKNVQGFFLLFIDLDDLKKINRLYDYETGDLMIKELSQRLKNIAEVNWPGCFVARMGGDEFGIILPISENGITVESFASNILDHIKQTVDLQGRYYNITASIGICSFPENGTSAAGLLYCAEKAMFNAKDNGKDQYALFSPVNILRR